MIKTPSTLHKGTMDPLNPLPSFVAQHNVALFGVSGTAYRVRTRAGTNVKAWVADPNTPQVNRYFCHGHALGTFTKYGYSIYSGPDLQAVLRDEYVLVGSVHNGRAGDIVVWYNAHPATLHPDHSAILKSVGLNPNHTANPATTLLSSKNGGHHPVGNYSLAQLMSVYGNNYATFRAR
jgi:hypothetical protein